MFARARNLVAATVASGALVLGLAPAAAADPIFQDGLVNVVIEDTNVIVAPQTEVGVQVPVGVAANVCDVNVAVLATLVDAGGVECDSTVNQRTEAAFEQIQRIIAR
jgi:hypothetical protein